MTARSVMAAEKNVNGFSNWQPKYNILEYSLEQLPAVRKVTYVVDCTCARNGTS